MSRADLKVHLETKRELDRIANRNGMTLIATASALVARWLSSTDEEQRRAIEGRNAVGRRTKSSAA